MAPSETLRGTKRNRKKSGTRTGTFIKVELFVVVVVLLAPLPVILIFLAAPVLTGVPLKHAAADGRGGEGTKLTHIFTSRKRKFEKIASTSRFGSIYKTKEYPPLSRRAFATTYLTLSRATLSPINPSHAHMQAMHPSPVYLKGLLAHTKMMESACQREGTGRLKGYTVRTHF